MKINECESLTLSHDDLRPECELIAPEEEIISIGNDPAEKCRFLYSTDLIPIFLSHINHSSVSMLTAVYILQLAFKTYGSII